MIDGSELWPRAVSAGEVTYPPGGRLGPRWQRDVQLVLVHAGTMTVTIDGRPRAPQQAGSVGLLLPGHRETFAFAPERATRHSWIQAALPALPGSLAARLERLPAAQPASPALAALARETVAAAVTLAPRARPLLHALAAATLWRYVTDAELRPDDRSGAVEDAREHLRANLHDPGLDLAALARAGNVSAAHLVRSFRRELGTTPIAYLWERRVEAGVELLANSGLPVKAIAARCGFKTVYHFSRRVRQATGAAPTELRRRRWSAAP